MIHEKKFKNNKRNESFKKLKFNLCIVTKDIIKDETIRIETGFVTTAKPKKIPVMTV